MEKLKAVTEEQKKFARRCNMSVSYDFVELKARDELSDAEFDKMMLRF